MRIPHQNRSFVAKYRQLAPDRRRSRSVFSWSIRRGWEPRRAKASSPRNEARLEKRLPFGSQVGPDAISGLSGPQFEQVIQWSTTMAILANCTCGKQYSVADAHAGKKFTCKACGNRGTVPDCSPDKPTPTVTATPSLAKVAPKGAETDDCRTKTCRFCAETIKAAANNCRFCGKTQPTTVGMQDIMAILIASTPGKTPARRVAYVAFMLGSLGFLWWTLHWEDPRITALRNANARLEATTDSIRRQQYSEKSKEEAIRDATYERLKRDGFK